MILLLIILPLIQSANLPLLMPQIPDSPSMNPTTPAPSNGGHINPNYDGFKWPSSNEISSSNNNSNNSDKYINSSPTSINSSNTSNNHSGSRIFDNTVLPPADAVQLNNYAEVQRRLTSSAPLKFVELIASINAAVFSPVKRPAAYLADVKILQAAAKAIEKLKSNHPSNSINILCVGANGGFVPLGLSMLSSANDRVTLLDSKSRDLITARSNVQRDGKELFFQRLTFTTGPLSMIASNFDLIVLNKNSDSLPLTEYEKKLASRGYLVRTSKNSVVYLNQLDFDGQRLLTLRDYPIGVQ